MPALIPVLLGGGLLLMLAAAGKKKEPTPPAVQPFPPWSGIPGIPGSQPPPGGLPLPMPPGGVPGVPVVGPGAMAADGCPVDANLPVTMLQALNAALASQSSTAGELAGAAAVAQAAGYPLAAECLRKRAAQLSQGEPPPPAGQSPYGPKPPWWDEGLLGPWPPALQFPWPGAQPPSPPPGGQPPPADGGPWGPRPAGYPAEFPWPPPIPVPAPGTPKPPWWDAGPGAWGVPWPGDASPGEPGGEIPPYVPGDVPPEEPGGSELPYPVPPVGKPPNPTDNPIVGSALEATFGVGDTYYGWAAYYTGIPILSSPSVAENFATLQALNSQISSPSAVHVGTKIYLPLTWVGARGLPPRPTSVYQSAGGYVP